MEREFSYRAHDNDLFCNASINITDLNGTSKYACDTCIDFNFQQGGHWHVLFSGYLLFMCFIKQLKVFMNDMETYYHMYNYEGE